MSSVIFSVPRSYLIAGIKITFTVGAFIWIAFHIDIKAVALALGSVSPSAVAVAVGLLLIQAVLAAWRWSLVGGLVPPRLHMIAALRLFMISLFYNQVLPTTIAGDTARVYGAVKAGARFTSAFAAVFIDRVLTLAALALLIFAAAGAQLISVGQAKTSAPALGLAAAVLVPILSLAMFRVPAFALARFPKLEAVESIAQICRTVFRDRRLSGLLALSIFIHGMSIAIIFELALELQLPVSFLDCLFRLPAVLLLAQLPVSAGGWGVREGAMALAFSSYAFDSERVIAVSVLFGFGQLLVGLIGGILLIKRR